MVQAKPKDITPADQRIANVERALREAESRFERELAGERLTRSVYVRIWLKRHGAPWWRFWRRRPALRVSQDELRAAADEGSRLAFDILPDGETLQISETSEETT